MQNEKNINEENENMSINELNYRKGYAFLFNGITDMTKMLAKMIKKMMILQKYSEELCISEPSETIKIDTEQILKIIVENVKQSIEESENEKT